MYVNICIDFKVSNCCVYFMQYFFMPGSSRLLQDEDVILLKPVCKKINLRLQPPVSVVLLKKVTIKEKFTG